MLHRNIHINGKQNPFIISKNVTCIYLYFYYKYVQNTGNKTIPEKVATTRTEDGHKQNTKTCNTIQTKRTKEHRTTEKEMEEPSSF